MVLLIELYRKDVEGSEKMKCPNCSKEISNDSTRCEYCGYDISRYKKVVERGIQKVSDKDIEMVYDKSEVAHRKAKKLSEKGGPFVLLFKRIKILISLLKDYKRKEYKEIPWRVIAAIVFAILYFLNPFDLIPDFIPGIGYIDDAAVIAFIFASIEHELKKYARWKGIDLE